MTGGQTLPSVLGRRRKERRGEEGPRREVSALAARSEGVDWQPVVGSGQGPRRCSQRERARSGRRPEALGKWGPERDAAPQGAPELHSDAGGVAEPRGWCPSRETLPLPLQDFYPLRLRTHRTAGHRCPQIRLSSLPALSHLWQAAMGSGGGGGRVPKSDDCFRPPELYRRPVCWPRLFVVPMDTLPVPGNRHLSP